MKERASDECISRVDSYIHGILLWWCYMVRVHDWYKRGHSVLHRIRDNAHAIYDWLIYVDGR